MSEEQIAAEMVLLNATEEIVSTAKALGYARERVWEDLMSSSPDASPTLRTLQRTQFDLIWPEA